MIFVGWRIHLINWIGKDKLPAHGTLEKQMQPFGIVPYEEDRPKQFIVLEETEGNFLADMQESYGVFMFLSLAYLLRAELGFDYDAYHNNGVDIVTKNKYGTYVEIAAEMAESAKACPLSFDEEIVEEWVSLPNKERINRLKQYYYLRSYQ